MSDKKALIIRYGAYGDIIHCSMLPRILAEDGYEVTFEYNHKGAQLLSHNPYITNHIVYEPTADPELIKNKEDVKGFLQARWDRLYSGFDRIINLNDTLERGTIAMEDMEEFDWPQEKRREKYDNNYYDWTLKCAGYRDLMGNGIRGEVYYTDEEHAIIKNFLAEYKDKFILLVNLSGTGLHKVYPFMDQVVQKFLDLHKNTVAITTGDKECQLLEFQHPQVIHKSGVWPFRQSLLLAKYVDGVIGCESGLMVGATMWDTRACQLMTAASLNCHIPNGITNDYSLQSNVKCSPCFTGPYKYRNCKFSVNYQLPICSVGFKPEDVQQKLEDMYLDWVGDDKNKYKTSYTRNSISYRKVKYSHESLECPICAKPDNEEVLRKNHKEVYFKCPDCQILYTHKENIEKAVYDEKYVKKYDDSSGFFKNEASYYLPKINEVAAGKSFLEIGPTTSTILDCAKEHEYNTYALDINPNYDTSHQLMRGDFEAYDFGDDKFDVIWLTHVFEHFLDPLVALEKLASILNNGGKILMAMPNPAAINWRNPYAWNHWHGKEHYIMWYPEAIIGALECRGFDIGFYTDKPLKGMPVTGDYHLIAELNK